ncbi:hypothetical protein N0V90_003188 [Kalmusia sp. IMI 367209]|nr:hypothetical protein N0V90_003188 [Kalmusia sp. IMI 367209]
MSKSQYAALPFVQIIRHGEALHNVERWYPHRDPPLTEAGHDASQQIKLATTPDIILISPMTRTIQTALQIFPFLQQNDPFPIPVEIWPDLREAHDAECNKGLSRDELCKKYPQFDFASCTEEWNYPPHTIERATSRAERVRKRLKELSGTHPNLAIVTHRGFIAFLVKGRRFNTCEARLYSFATEDEAQKPEIRIGVNCDTLLEQDFGPTVLVLEKDAQQDIVTSLS